MQTSSFQPPVLLKRTAPLPTPSAVYSACARLLTPLEIQNPIGRLSVNCPIVWDIKWIIHHLKRFGTRLPALRPYLQELIMQGSSIMEFNGHVLTQNIRVLNFCVRT